MRFRRGIVGGVAGMVLLCAYLVSGQESVAPDDPGGPGSQPEAVETLDTPTNRTPSEATVSPVPETTGGAAAEPPNLILLEGLTRLSRDHEIWIDVKKRRVIVGGKVCLTQGFLEMFACPRGTKEHESIVALNAQAYQIHAALLAIGTKPGEPVRYQPTYRPATGPVIQVEVQWKDAQGKPRTAPAQQWIRHVKKDTAMEYDWVFAGSGFWKDTATGKEHYLAEGGEVICVSNFGTALLDLPIQSSQDNADLMFEAFTDHIPPRDTPVRIILSEKESAKSQDPKQPIPIVPR